MIRSNCCAHRKTINKLNAVSKTEIVMFNKLASSNGGRLVVSSKTASKSASSKTASKSASKNVAISDRWTYSQKNSDRGTQVAVS